MGTNRAILLTAPGAAAIAVIRIIGPDCEKFLAAHFSKQLDPLRCVHGELRDGGRVIDDPVIVLHESRDRADINLHGGPWVVQSCLDFLTRNGFIVVDDDLDATDGEDEIEREMLANLHLAKTDLALRALLAQPAAWKRSRPTDVNDRALWWLLHPPTVAIVGVPNVGKSTLANQLFAQQRSITADVPGTTRDWVGELANVDGLVVKLIDTPGIRDTTDEIERTAIKQAGQHVRDADLIILVLDVTRDLPEQRALLNRHPIALAVANKSDLPAKWDAGAYLRISASTGAGVDALRRQIQQHFGVADSEIDKARVFTTRHRALPM